MNFMEKGVVLVFIFLFSIGFVLGAGEWGDVNIGDDDAGTVVDEAGVPEYDDVVSTVPVGSSASGSDKIYTRNFYFALGVGLVGVLLVVLFFYLFLRRPKNKWKKNK